jgi:hypothetical protein
VVAKSYQKLEQVGEPFLSNGRYYVQIKTLKGVLKIVRWYSTKEYAKMYPNEPVPKEEEVNRIKTQKEVLGFSKGYITIFKGNTYEDKEYFKMNHARYSCLWGWYFISTDEIPEDLPADVEPIRLNWELVGNEDETLKSEKEVSEVVDSLIYEPDISEYQGNIGDRISVILTVEKAIALDGYYGPSTMHVMRDYDGNCYVWTTSARSWEEGTEHSITGTVKDHKFYKGIKQTVLTRCLERN